MLMVETAGRQGASESARLSLVGPRDADNATPKFVMGGFAGRLLELLRDAFDLSALRVSMRPRRRNLRVIETLQLGTRKQIVLLSYKGERFLVGTGADSVDTIVRLRPLMPGDEEGQARRWQADETFGDRT